MGGNAARAEKLWPQLKQNLLPSGFIVPHWGQEVSILWPQSLQNLAFSELSNPHFGHFIKTPAALGREMNSGIGGGRFREPASRLRTGMVVRSSRRITDQRCKTNLFGPRETVNCGFSPPEPQISHFPIFKEKRDLGGKPKSLAEIPFSFAMVPKGVVLPCEPTSQGP